MPTTPVAPSKMPKATMTGLSRTSQGDRTRSDQRPRLHQARLGALQVRQCGAGVASIERALEIVPNAAPSLEIRGNIFEALGRKEEAIADYRGSLSLYPNLKGSAEGLKRLGASL